MNRQETLDQIKRDFGFVPDWVEDMPDAVLEQFWAVEKWAMSDSELSAREKALIAFGASTAIHCSY